MRDLMEYGLSAIKHIPNKEGKYDNIVQKLKSYENIIEEDLKIIEKVADDGIITNNKKNKKSKSTSKKTQLYISRSNY
jgi:hypothetical protein